MEQEAFSPSLYGVQPPPIAMPQMLRPLSTGEILDRTFGLYRRRFWLFSAIGMLPAAAVTLSTAARLIYLALGHGRITPSQNPAGVLASSMSQAFLVQIYFLPATLLFVVAYGLSQAATVYAVGRANQGTRIEAMEAYRAVGKRWLRWVGIAMRQFWSMVWPILPIAAIMLGALGFAATRNNTFVLGLVSLLAALLLPAAIVFGIINLLRNMLGMQAGAEENLGVNLAMRRSKALVAGRKGRIFLVLLLAYALQVVAGGFQLPFVWLATTSRGAEHIVMAAAELIISFVTTALVSPVASIALTLLYVDERVRREGYDIDLLMQANFAQQAATVADFSR